MKIEEKKSPLGTVKNLLTLGYHPVLKKKWSLGQRAADKLTSAMGSWFFIMIFFILLVGWMWLNAHFLVRYSQGDPFDPYPFILLNLVLSCLAAIQAPIILMSQNREAQKDRIKSEYDYQVNRKALKEIKEIKEQIINLKRK